VLPETVYHALSDELIDESIQLLPHAWEMDSVEAFKDYLKSALPQGAQSTRKRAAVYLCHRFFGNGHIDRPLLAMLRSVSSYTEKRELVAYRFMQAEPLVGRCVTDLLFEKVITNDFLISSSELRQFIAERLGKESEKSLVRLSRILVKFGHLVKLRDNGHRYEIRQLQPSFNTLVYACHDEFGIPAMYRMEDISIAQFRKLFLLSPTVLRAFIKRAADAGLIRYVQAGGLEQIRTQYSLAEVVTRLTGIDIDALY
jgi:hypothetical protein